METLYKVRERFRIRSVFLCTLYMQKNQSFRIVKYDMKPNCVWLTTIFFPPENYGEQRTDGVLDITWFTVIKSLENLIPM